MVCTKEWDGSNFSYCKKIEVKMILGFSNK